MSNTKLKDTLTIQFFFIWWREWAIYNYGGYAVSVRYAVAASSHDYWTEYLRGDSESDISGRRVLGGATDASGYATIDLHGLPRATYFVRVTTSSSTVIKKLVVK